ncbi:MAG: hypothetical protein CR986_02430 [Ignavibacteriae bacterium]|nr:MAG: hypothetical protein CR986_02430 [Ignavibacteriota bacterium]
MINRKLKPEPFGKVNFRLPEINRFKLKNGLSVYHSFKNTLPIIQLKLFMPSGSIYDPINKKGVSTLASLLMDEGAGNLTGLEISDKIENLGSILNINSGKEFTTLSLLCLKENFIPSIEILSTIVSSPHFNESDFNREIKRLESQILQLNADPSFLAWNYFNKKIFASTPYQFSSYGLLKDLKNIANSNIKKFYENHSSAHNSFMVAVGDVKQKEIEGIFNNHLNKLKNTKTLNSVNYKLNNSEKQILLIDKMNSEQSEIRVGHLTKGRNVKDYYACLVLNTILGGQFSSRLNHNLREVKGYTYGIHSNFNYNKLGGSFSISTSVKSENTADALKEILFELKEIQKTITQEEIDFAKSYLVRRFPALFETYNQIAANVSSLPIFNLPDNYFVNYIDKINNVTLNNVEKASIDNILLDNLLIVVVGNKHVLKSSIELFAKENNFQFNET